MFDEKDGHLIKYEIKEDPVPGYKTILGSDYIVNKSLIDIPIEKKWIGKEKNEVVIQLYRDYEVTDFEFNSAILSKTQKTELVTTIRLNKENN